MAHCCGFPNLGRSKKKKVYVKFAVCSVCLGLDGDSTIKEVEYCDLCDAWICTKCTPRWLGRGWLATKKMFGI